MIRKSKSAIARKSKIGALAAIVAAFTFFGVATPAVASGPAAAAATTAPAASTPASVAAVTATPCGFHMEGILAHYNHCSNDGTNVFVQVTSVVAPGAPPGLGGGLTLLCLSPGNHSLVPFVYGIITGAHSDGIRCDSPNA